MTHVCSHESDNTYPQQLPSIVCRTWNTPGCSIPSWTTESCWAQLTWRVHQLPCRGCSKVHQTARQQSSWMHVQINCLSAPALCFHDPLCRCNHPSKSRPAYRRRSRELHEVIPVSIVISWTWWWLEHLIHGFALEHPSLYVTRSLRLEKRWIIDWYMWCKMYTKT